jgi:hypothetical protein
MEELKGKTARRDHIPPHDGEAKRSVVCQQARAMQIVACFPQLRRGFMCVRAMGEIGLKSTTKSATVCRTDEPSQL